MPKASTQRVMTFLAARDIVPGKSNTVAVNIDESCDMAEVLVNEKMIMVGNFWDFRPEVHGLDLPRFSGHDDLARVFQCALLDAGHAVDTVENREWEFQD